MVNLFPYFWKRIIITGVWPGENEKLNIKIHWFMAETIDIRELNERIERQSAFVTNLTTGMDQVIVGQKHLVESLLIGLLSSIRASTTVT